MDSIMITLAQLFLPYLAEIAASLVVVLLARPLRRLMARAESRFDADAIAALNEELGRAIRRGIAEGISRAGDANPMTIRSLATDYVERTKAGVVTKLEASREQLMARVQAEMAEGADWIEELVERRFFGPGADD